VWREPGCPPNLKNTPVFVIRLRQAPAMAARALEFAILTASRSCEVLGARWAEIDLGKRRWVVPAERMKGGIGHTAMSASWHGTSEVNVAQLPEIPGLPPSERNPPVIDGGLGGRITWTGGRPRSRCWIPGMVEGRLSIRGAGTDGQLPVVSAQPVFGSFSGRSRKLSDSWADAMPPPA
jgi:hypothetical protein